MSEPCTCSGPNPNCRRAGVPMIGRLWELCSCNCPAERPCSAEMSEKYRSAWDAAPKQPGPATVAEPARAVPLIGDLAEAALSSVGITKERVLKWFGECRCGERQQKANALDAWARDAASMGVEKARSALYHLFIKR